MKHMIKIFSTIMLSLALLVGISFAETQRLGTTRASFNPSKSVTKTAAYTALVTDSQIRVNALSAAITITLPSVSDAMAGMRASFKIIKIDTSTNMVTVTAGTGDTIGGEASRKIINYNDYMIIEAGPGRDWTVKYESSYLAENHYAGTVAMIGGAGSYQLFGIVSTTTTLTTADCGRTIGAATDNLIVNLPSVAQASNCMVRVVNVCTKQACKISLKASTLDTIKGLTASPEIQIDASAGNYITLTKALSYGGDFINLVTDGISKWFIVGSSGPWTHAGISP